MNGLGFTVYHVPAPQGSKVGRSPCGQAARVCPRCRKPHLVTIVLAEASRRTGPWRTAVTGAARAAILREPGWEPITGPVGLTAVFAFARPASHYRAGRNAHLLRDGAPPYPSTGRGDLSKLVRSTEDALTDAGVWKDDAQVQRYVDVEMVWLGGHPMAPQAPGAWICVSEIPEGA